MANDDGSSADEIQQQADEVAATVSGSLNGHSSESDKATIAKLSAQLKRLNDANLKYKNLLKLAKERIEQKEIETNTLQKEHALLADRISDYKEKEALWSLNAPIVKNQSGFNSDESNATLQQSAGLESNVVRIYQRVKNKLNDGKIEIWVLVEVQTMTDDGSNVKRFREWKKFDTDQQVEDFVRRDTGEPITLPPYSLSKEESRAIQEQAEQQLSKLNDEFRRFRVKSEMTRKQSETLIRELQSSLAQKVTQTIENDDRSSRGKMNGKSAMTDSEQVRSFANQIERLKIDLSRQESNWKQKYEILLSENTALKSSGSESLLASQWRQRYEQCLKEKEEMESKIKHSQPSSTSESEYEAKYRDLKESFRIYRKKAKEIFEAQQLGSSGALTSSAAMGITSNSSADAKLSYLKNLMINYFTADPSVRDHMLGAIGTVLQFTPDEQQRIDAKKLTQSSTSWF